MHGKGLDVPDLETHIFHRRSFCWGPLQDTPNKQIGTGLSMTNSTVRKVSICFDVVGRSCLKEVRLGREAVPFRSPLAFRWHPSDHLEDD